MGMTIRGKLTGMAAVVLAVIALMAGITYYRGDAMMRGLVNNAGMEVVANAAANLDERFNSVDGMLLASAESIRHSMTQLGVSGEEDTAKLAAALTKRVRSVGIGSVKFGHEATGRLSDGTGWKAPADYDARVRPWYKSAVAAGEGKVFFSEPFRDMIANTLVISVSTPIYDDAGKLLGVVVGDMDVQSMNKYVVALNLFGKGNGMLLLKSGIPVAYSAEEDVLKTNMLRDEKIPEAVRNIAKKMVAGERGFETYTYQGEERQIFFTPTKRGFFLGILFPVSEIAAMVRALTTVLLGIAAAAIVVVALVIFLIVRGLNRAIGSMKRATDKLGAGDLTVRYDDSGSDEIARISQNLNAMVSSMREVMTSIRRESDETARRAETLASLSEETLSSMEEIAGSITKVRDMMEHSSSALQETNASIEEISSGAQASAQATGEGAEGATKASEAASGSVSEVNEVIGDIRKAEGESDKSIVRIKELAQSVDDISGFVSTITSIADQTNLLALNAAIEAARAGEAGRGFAVVAEEVRKLAEDSARAAQEVDKLIGGLQKRSEESIAATETTGRILDETMKKAAATQERLRGAVAEIGKVAEAVQSIAAVSQEQAASSEEMTSAIQNVTESTTDVVHSVGSIQSASEETAKAAEAIATEAQEMAATAEALQNLVARFVLHAGDENGGGLVPMK